MNGIPRIIAGINKMADWRCDLAHHIRGVTLWKSTYIQFSADWNHDHCAGCGARFAEFDGPDILREGYTTGPDYKKGARYEWVCEQCFSDLKDEMGWSVGTATILKWDRP